MKRSWNEVDHQVESLTTMANCLVLLSQGRELSFPSPYNQDHSMINSPSSRVFECKTCNRQFPSFQALGGHRASHKKPRLLGVEGGLDQAQSPAKPKTHECSVCGLEFAIGQALGGHMRRHRTAMNDQSDQTSQAPLSPEDKPSQVVVKKSKSRRVFGLDLNLTPFENDLELLRLGKAAPMVDCFF